MKRNHIGLILVIAAFPLTLDAQDKTEIVISGHKIGDLMYIGQDIDSVICNLSQSYKVSKENVPVCSKCNEYETGYVVTDAKGTLCSFIPGWADTTHSTIVEFRTQRKEFVTDKGIRVGMTFGDLQHKYRVLNVNYARGLDTRVIVKGVNGAFGVEMPPGMTPRENNFSTLLPFKVPITEIIIF